LPVPVANNAVALVGDTAFSFAGLKAGKTHSDVTAEAFSVNLATGDRRVLPPLPDGKGRLASVAVAVEGRIYVFGGYTVAADGAEVSTPDVFVFDPAANAYTRGTQMPLPVDDSVAFAHGTLIYLVSGWHNDGNVTAVQIYDTKAGTWSRATDYPGTPVFGHAGGFVGRSIVIMGGVTAEKLPTGKNKYAASAEAWFGEIDAADAQVIRWRPLPVPPVKARYRIAAVGSARLGVVVFSGGATNPYNYNGIGYDKKPSAASDDVFAFDVPSGLWRVYPRKARATMDHRGLLEWNGSFCTVGGMQDGQHVAMNIDCVVPEGAR
jgi:N-acetylneuraminic acid mutarotase